MTSTMLRTCLTAAVVTIVALAPVSVAETAPGGNPLAGSWSGTWSIAERNLSGTFDWTISDEGQLKGKVTDTLGRSGALAGHVGADGDVMMIGFAPNDNPPDGNGFPFQGTATIDGEGNLDVSLISRDSDRLLLVAILERK